MKVPLGIAALVLLGACGGASNAPESPDPAASSPAQAPPSDPLADTKPLQRELPPKPPYLHTALVGKYSAEIDPADLQPVAEKAMACGGFYEPWEYIDEVRALALGRAKRDGNELQIGAETLVDYGPIDVAGVTGNHDSAFFYLGVLKQLDLDVVFVRPSEDVDYQIVDRSSGTSVTIDGLPIASPSGQYLAALSDSEMNWVGLEIVERGKAGLKTVTEVETRTYPCGLRWVSDTRATFRELKPAAIERGTFGRWRDETRGDYGDASVELRNGEWVYTPATD